MKNSRKLFTTALAAAMIAGSLSVSTPASAWHRWGRRPGWGRWGYGGAGLGLGVAGLATGLALGAAASAPYGYGYPGYYGAATPGCYGYGGGCTCW